MVMKKIYMAPAVEEVKIQSIELLGVSGGGGSIFNDLGGGGVDVGGGLDPDAPALTDPEGLPGLPI